jgi:hypothetical protein
LHSLLPGKTVEWQLKFGARLGQAPPRFSVDVSDRSPVRFCRPRGLRPLPVPEKGGSLQPLWGLVNAREKDRVLVAAFLLMTLNPWGPYPGLFLHGPQGSAKSTGAALLRALVDPNKAKLRKPPRDEDTLVLAARNALVPVLDNLSHLSQDFSDSLCRLLTGGGIGKRQLYTDLDEIILDIKRPAIINGIPELATAGDLADRAIKIELATISGKKRLREGKVREEFAAAHSGMLGALLDAAVVALCDHESVVLPGGLSRMADFECWAAAGLPTLGFSVDDFLKAYRSGKKNAAATVLDNSLVAMALAAR